MSCDDTKFVISKGSKNTFIFTIKQDNSTLPLTIEVGDTFFASLIELENNTPYAEVTNKALTVDNAAGGRVSLVIPKLDTDNLVTDRGSKTDRYYNRPVYKMLIECSTVNNGDFIAKVQEVYVD
tara:strand:+ start:4057 stop:4428 length:372 start_codon:yes stop_codon:yes gene_type:complete